MSFTPAPSFTRQLPLVGLNNYWNVNQTLIMGWSAMQTTASDISVLIIGAPMDCHERLNCPPGPWIDPRKTTQTRIWALRSWEPLAIAQEGKLNHLNMWTCCSLIYGPTIINTTEIFRAFRAYLHRNLRVFRRWMQRKSIRSSIANVSIYNIYVSQAICHIREQNPIARGLPFTRPRKYVTSNFKKWSPQKSEAYKLIDTSLALKQPWLF